MDGVLTERKAYRIIINIIRNAILNGINVNGLNWTAYNSRHLQITLHNLDGEPVVASYCSAIC